MAPGDTSLYTAAVRFPVRLATLLALIATFAAFGGKREPRTNARARESRPAGERATEDESAAEGSEDEGSEDEGAEGAGTDEESPEGEGRSAEPADEGPRPEERAEDEHAGEDELEPLTHGDAGAERARKPRGGCPASMVRVRQYCVDRYEAPNRRGARPLVMQSANDALAWCTERNKRLCTEDEWIDACEGDERRAYPYGPSHLDGVCTDDKTWRHVDEATLAKWPAPEAHAHAKELYQATPSGSKHKCASQDGVRDMTGNVEEWVVRTREHANAWPYLLIGCYWAGCYGGGKPTCHSTNDAHGPEFRFYETGFRCCRDVARAK